MLFLCRNVKVQKTYIPDSLARITDCDITYGTQVNLKKTAIREEPINRSQILEYILTEILHVSVSI
jgi:hypothetical protein